jgi:glycosyltransferase involved in cell wall biosynthesis
VTALSQRPLKVAILADAVFDSLGGAAKGRPDGLAASWLPSSAGALLEREDLEIIWISLVRGLKGRGEEKSGRHHFIELPAFPVSIDTWLNYRVARRRLLSELRALQVDLVHCWGSESPYPSVIGHTDRPTVISLNGILAGLKRRGLLPDGIWWQRQAGHETRWLSQVDAVIAESRWTEAEVRKTVPAARTFAASYGVHSSFYQLAREADRGSPYLLFAGTLSHAKGVDLLLDALTLLPDRKWICRIAGDGPMRDQLKSRGIPGVEWLGSLAWPAYQEVLRHASALVLPTRADSHPNVVKEARVVGIPVITTRQGGQADYLRDGENACLLDEPDAAALAAALDRWMNDPAALQAAGLIGNAEDRERFDSRETARNFADIYREVARGGSADLSGDGRFDS